MLPSGVFIGHWVSRVSLMTIAVVRRHGAGYCSGNTTLAQQISLTMEPSNSLIRGYLMVTFSA